MHTSETVNDNHVGIDSNAFRSNSSAPVAYFAGGSKIDLNLMSGKSIVAWIDYDSGTNLVNVTIPPSSTKSLTPLLSYRIDLSPILHETTFVGFSASTGLFASSHFVLGCSFTTIEKDPPLDLRSLPSIPETKN
ncbi:concanavalin A-like lectin protein kinase family protein [Striga asiatica]|uniref:Concanavalin A-like lectin protein kinase family protein n=1 Tax=Striga asiatica TaxID=4170 RepID=A0A5A7Q3J2_STRAF|nr:concanavalin A-like lectin protein kinase family protein [Striga asiatica]